VPFAAGAAAVALAELADQGLYHALAKRFVAKAETMAEPRPVAAPG
jgi:hypothetical protein